MDEQDAYFTHTIVGAPFSLLMGRRMGSEAAQAAGVAVEPDTGATRLGPAWQVWAIDRVQDWPAGMPRRRPHPVRPHPAPRRFRSAIRAASKALRRPK